MEQLLFVYGSLRQGHSAHHLLKSCRRLPDGELTGCELVDHHGYPLLKPGFSTVRGEVYGVRPSRWAALDAWEEAPDVYERMPRALNDGRRVWLYQRPNARPSAAAAVEHQR